MNIDEQYCVIMREIIHYGDWPKDDDNRTGIRQKSLFSRFIKCDLRDGFPLLTSRRVPYKSAFVEVEGFLKGITDKKWYEDRGCKFWSFWANPQKVPYANDEETKKLMREECDLGLIYGSQWRNFSDPKHPENGVDQLKNVVEKIRKKEDDRRLLISAWNPLALDHMALPPCHFGMLFHISPCKTYLDLMFFQRSVDFALGHNIHNYALILTLMAHEGGLIPRNLTGVYGNTHLYENQIELAKQQVKCYQTNNTHDSSKNIKLPQLKLLEWKFNDIFDWTSDCVKIENYEYYSDIKYPLVAI